MDEYRPWDPPARIFELGEERSFGGDGSNSLSRILRLAKGDFLTRPYQQAPLVYACINARKKAMVRIPWRLWQSDDADAEEVDEADPVRSLFFARANPITSARRLWKTLSTNDHLAGGTYLVLYAVHAGKVGPVEVDARGEIEVPTEIWPVREDMMRVLVDSKTKLPREYELTVEGGERIVIPAHAVAHIYDPDPHDMMRGFGAMNAAHRRANVAFLAEGFDEALLENGGRIGGVFSHESKIMTDSQRKGLETSFASKTSAKDTHGKNIVLPAGLKFDPLAFSPRDMDFLNMRTWTREEIMMVFGATKPLLGLTDDVNRANAREARRVFYENTVLPFADDLASEITSEVLARLPAPFNEYVLGYDVTALTELREDTDKLLDRTSKLMERGLSFEESTATLGWDVDMERVPIKHKAQHWVGTSLRPVDAALAEDPASVPPIGDEPDRLEEPDEEKSVTKYASGLSHAQRRSMAIALQARVDVVQARFAKSAAKVMRGFILAQRRRLIEAAGNRLGLNGSAGSLRRWAFSDEEVIHPVLVKGVSEDELAQLLIGNLDKWGEDLWTAVQGKLRESLVVGAQSAAEDTGGNPFDPDRNLRAIQVMQSKEVLLKEGPMSEIAKQVKRQVINALAGAPDTGSLAQRVAAVLEDLKAGMATMADRIGQRAQMIARTEVGSAFTTARVEQYAQDGVAQIEWLSAGDELVRDGHDIDGEVQVIGTTFSNGLKWPKESGAPVGEVVNCRCDALPVI